MSEAMAIPIRFSGQSLNSDKPINISQINKGLVVVFLSSTCPCSNSHIKELISLSEKFKDLTFLAVHSNADESVDEAKEYFKQAKLPFDVLRDENSKIANLLSASKTPHAFLISPKGDILYNGGVTDSSDGRLAKEFYLRKAIEDFLLGKKVNHAKTRTLGCVISRRQ